ncbi:MAG: formylglycine-generating enzyme family protein [Taibaiella sp.]|nr:formylglycine-generating enzyme family protein [Taibaiella sp.]
MYIKRSLLFAGVLFITASSLSTNSIAQENPNYHKSRTRPVIPYRHVTLAAPPGMVYVPGGSVTIKYSQSSTDTNSKKRVSLSSFYIDKTEVTNQQYRMFTEWVIDSIAIVNYLKDDKYFLDPPPGGYKDESAKTDLAKVDTASVVKDTIPSYMGSEPTAATAPVIDTATTPKFTTSSAVTDSNGKIIRRRIDWANIKHKDIFESNDDEIKAKIAPMFDPVTGKIREELYVYNFTYLKATGTNKNVKIGEYTTEPINVYPDEKIWFKDMNNSQVDILVENYFTQPPFDDYPVVGVTWKQARAFAAWRSHTNFDYAKIADYLRYYKLQYSLPSEAQWVYAAGKDIKNTKQQVAEPEPDIVDTVAVVATDTAAAMMPTTDSAALAAAPTTEIPVTEATEEEGGKKKKKSKKQRRQEEEEAAAAEEAAMVAVDKKVTPSKPDKNATPVDKDRNGNLLVNFKQEEGDYTEDGANFTLPVMSYAPNEYGVYNMVGNVAEWVLDAYSPSAFAFVSDVNPVLLYDADPKDADAMKRKVVRGGSFVSNAKALSPFTRDYELQDNLHCFIGFRCVMSAPEILTKTVATRRKETSSAKPVTTKKTTTTTKSKSKK